MVLPPYYDAVKACEALKSFSVQLGLEVQQPSWGLENVQVPSSEACIGESLPVQVSPDEVDFVLR